MHKQLMDWLKELKRGHSYVFRNRCVFEGGSMDVNGSPRSLFENCTYLGVDWRDGPGVDSVGLIHEFVPDATDVFHTIVCTETLEHDPHWRLSLARMINLLVPYGSLVISAAAPGRTPHRKEHAPDGEYYGNVEPVELLAEIWQTAQFQFTSLVLNTEHHDIYLFCDNKLEEVTK